MKPAVLPNLRHLKVFAAVARLQSVSRASTEIHLSQPAVTQAIAKLEREFQATLLERRWTGSYPTTAGSILLMRAQRLFSQIEQAVDDLLTRTGPVDLVSRQLAASKITSAHIRALASISENASFDEAAHAIGISQASLHRTARDLEKILRRSLYQRTARGVTTTRAGAELARRLKVAALEIRYASEEINVAEGAVRARINIGVPALANSIVLTRSINDLLERYPKTHVLVIERPYRLLLDGLRSGEIDVLFGMLHRPAWVTDIVEEPFYFDPYSVAVRRKHPLTSLPKIAIENLAEYDWIVPSPEGPRRWIFETIFSQYGRLPSTSIETSSLTTHLSALASSDRVALLKKSEVESHERLGILTILPFPTPLPPRPVGITTRAGWHPTPVQQCLIEVMRIQARQVEHPV